MRPFLFRKLLACLIVLALQACTLSSHPYSISTELGKPSSMAALEAQIQAPGPLTVKTVTSVDWKAPLGGLINLKSEKAKAAGLKDRDETISVYAHVLKHPIHGTFLIDTGVAAALLKDPVAHGINWLVQRVMAIEKMTFKQSTAQIVASLDGPLKGIFLTHMHLDHISGVPDLDPKIPLYFGQAEISTLSLMNVIMQSVTDGLLGKERILREWDFKA